MGLILIFHLRIISFYSLEAWITKKINNFHSCSP
jgi:hypothetical protein